MKDDGFEDDDTENIKKKFSRVLMTSSGG